ncbi:hypothetical protein XFF6166_60073 [Xanthomonas citri pv. fuscans]|nr:hypothetical protein XFF6166_60073 [Xanthomonas citri pv. fuscans]SOO04531.1 hypothetical protein XFF7767_250072 [Xanthomonas citri pv. fuscans]SOO07932.1 hypothetical protein XFF6970_120070 [Xanthomonas citri pv. fuscans]SOO44632.1 hypothetical protein XFF1815_60036 [Xanthomonas citri pv. fuscans]
MPTITPPACAAKPAARRWPPIAAPVMVGMVAVELWLHRCVRLARIDVMRGRSALLNEDYCRCTLVVGLTRLPARLAGATWPPGFTHCLAPHPPPTPLPLGEGIAVALLRDVPGAHCPTQNWCLLHT